MSDNKSICTEDQGVELLKLQHELKEIAIPVGSLHAFWDLIMDIDAALKGKEGVFSDPDELIAMAKSSLEKRKGSK